jgi:hypothetical protein
MRSFLSVVGRFIGANWRGFFAVLPLPMLGLAASYGVFRFALVFVPAWVAIITASSFEFVYIGLAVYNKFTAAQRREALHISLGAVAVSVLYNALDGVFHRRPWLLDGMPWWGDVLLALVHGLPLAVLAFLVSRLVMHPASVTQNVHATPSNNRSESSKTLVGGRLPEYTLDGLKTFLDGREYVKRSDVVDGLGCSASRASELLSEAVGAGVLRKNGVGYYVEN